MSHNYDSTDTLKSVSPNHDNLVLSNLGAGREVLSTIDLQARYLLQLYLMLRTARRQNNARVVFALRDLIALRRGVI